MEDVVVGAIIGLTFSQILLTPDPVRMIDAAAGGLFLKLAEAFRSAAAALQTRDPVKAEAALAAFSASHDSLITLGAGIDAARYAARWSLRGRLAAHAVAEVAARYDRRAIRLYASSLLFAEALANALRKDAGRAPPGLAEQILDAADRCEKLAAAADIQEADHRSDAIETTRQGEWSYVQFHYHAVSDVLHSLEQLQHSTLSVTGQHARTGEFDQIHRSG
ncbi:hypothetical protein [Roseomonas mucosa]|nr:hypothetical protein [Roseomonas mucosa]